MKTGMLLAAISIAAMCGPAAALEICDPLLQKPIVTTTSSGARLCQLPNTATAACQRWDADALRQFTDGPGDLDSASDDSGDSAGGCGGK